MLDLHSKPGKAVIFDADQWLSVLGLAHKYDMTGIREVTIQGLQSAKPPLPPAKQLAFARKYNCDELANAPFQVLATRAEPLSKDEMAQLPLDDLYRLVVAREKSLHAGPPFPPALPFSPAPFSHVSQGTEFRSPNISALVFRTSNTQIPTTWDLLRPVSLQGRSLRE